MSLLINWNDPIMALERSSEYSDVMKVWKMNEDIGISQEQFSRLLPEDLSTTWTPNMATEREQKLIDLGFSLVIAAYGWNKDNPDVTMEELAAWTRAAYRECGFNVSDGEGSSWGVLDKNRPYIKNTDGIAIDAANRPD